MSRPFLQIPSSSQLVFTGNVAVTWKVTLQNNVASILVQRTIPGVLYVFILAQDAIGGRSFNWPLNCLNASPINLAPNAVTVQCFIGMANNILAANMP
jgi:hypothetical protein